MENAAAFKPLIEDDVSINTYIFWPPKKKMLFKKAHNSLCSTPFFVCKQNATLWVWTQTPATGVVDWNDNSSLWVLGTTDTH